MRTEQEGEEGGWLPSVLAATASWACRRPWLVLLLAGLSCALCLHFTWTHLKYETHRTDLISPQKDFLQRWQQYLAEFGDDDDMVVVVQGQDRARMEEALEELAWAIGQRPQYFDRLFYKVDLRGLRNRALLFLPTEQVRDIQDSLQTMELLLEPPVLAGLDPLFGWKSLSLLQLVNEGERRAAGLSAGPKLAPAQTAFWQQLASISRSAASVVDNAAAYQNPWRSLLPASDQQDLLAQPQYFFSGDGSLAFLLVRPVKEENGFTAWAKSVEALRQLVADVGQGYPGLGIGLTGLPVLETDEMLASQNDANLASWLALAGVALLYLVVYRGLRYPLMTVATLLVGTVWALGWLTLTVGHLNILSSAFAVMLIGMGDYGVLWVTRFTQERQAGADLATAMARTAQSVGPGILIAALATALAFYAAMLADLKAVTELGWIAGSGVLLCALSCFTVMPALLAVWHRKDEGGRMKDEKKTRNSLDLHPSSFILHPSSAEWLPALARRPHLVIAVSVAVTAVFAFFALRVRYDYNLLHMQADSLESVQWEKKLIEHTAGASWHVVSYTTTPEEALALKARYQQLPDVSRVVEVASLVPRDQQHKLEVLGDIHQRLRKLPQRGVVIPHPLPRTRELQQAVARLHAVVGNLDAAGKEVRNLLPERPEGCCAQKVSDPFSGVLQGLQTLHEQLAKHPPEQAARRLQEFEQWMTRDLAEDLHQLRDVSTPRPITVADLPTCLRERYLGKNGKWLVRVFGKQCLWEYHPLEKFLAQIRTVDPEAAGKPFNTLEGLKAMKSGFCWAGVYALAAMVLVLVLDFRNLRHTLAALAPLFMGMVFALGVMGLLGLPLNPANMIALPLILGVGADNGVHVLHDYRNRQRGRRYCLRQATGRGIMVAALTTILGFGTLMISTHRGLSSLGLVLTLGVSCCMLTALVFLPAVLRLLSRRGQAGEKGVGNLLGAAPSGPSRQKVPDPFSPGQPQVILPGPGVKEEREAA